MWTLTLGGESLVRYRATAAVGVGPFEPLGLLRIWSAWLQPREEALQGVGAVGRDRVHPGRLAPRVCRPQTPLDLGFNPGALDCAAGRHGPIFYGRLASSGRAVSC